MEEENVNITDEAIQETADNSKNDQDTKEDIVKTDLNSPDTEALDKYASAILTGYSKPAIAEAMVNKDKFVEIYGDQFVNKFKGNKGKAKEALDQQYELISKAYQDQAEEESNFKMLENISFMAAGLEDIEFVGEDYALDSYIDDETTSGRKILMGEWTDPTRSIREVSLMSKKVIDYKGDIIEYEEDLYGEVAGESKYTDDKGNTIMTFEYLPYSEYQRDSNLAVKAIYEGETPKNEIVSRYDSSDSFLSNNGLDSSTWKVAVGSVFDFVIDTVDTLFAMAQYNPTNIALYAVGQPGMFDAGATIRNRYLKPLLTSTSDKDQADMITLNNAVGLGIEIAGQLLTGRAISAGMSKLVGVGVKSSQKILSVSKALESAKGLVTSSTSAGERLLGMKNVARLSKELKILSKSFNRKSNVVKGVTLASMGAMQAKHTADEAGKAGFTPSEQSLIYLASLGGMMLANNISDLGFERLGLNAINPILKKSAQDGMKGITPTAGGVLKVFSKSKAIAENTRFRLQTALSGSSIVAKGVQEGIQEETEFIFDELIKHTATALSTLKYDTEAPKFQTMMDEGYWDNFALESLMNIGVGAIAGAGSSVVDGSYKHGKTDETNLPQSGNTADVYKKVGYYATRTGHGVQLEKQLRTHLKKLRKKGGLGREDISTKWDTKNSRYKRVNELTDADIRQGHSSQAEIQYRANVAQFEYYKHIFANTSQKFDEILNENEDLALVMKSGTLFEENKALLEKKALLYSKSASGDIDIDAKLKDLEKEKIKSEETGKDTKDDKAYQTKIEELSSVTKLSTEDIETLMNVNRQLDDIRTGRAMHDMFLKFQLNSPKYNGKLTFDDLKDLVISDKDAQEDFKETNKKFLEHQNDNDTIVEENMDEEGNISESLVQNLSDNPSGLLFSEESIDKIRKGILNLGVTLDQQKLQLYKRILPDIYAAVDATIKDGGKFYDADDAVDGNDLATNFVKDLDAATYKGTDAINEVIKQYQNLIIRPGDKTDLSTARFGYALKKLLDVSTVADPNGFKAIKYDIGNMSENTINAIHGTLHNTTDDFGLSPLISTILNTESESRPLGMLITEDTSQDFLDLLDPYKSKEKVFGILSKDELMTVLSRSNTYNPNDIRSDLLYGFNKTPSGKIKVNSVDLIRQYNNLVSGFPTKEGEVSFFSDLDSAQKFLDQVDTRLAEVEFLREFLPTLAKIDQLNKEEFNNEGTESTFLTEYIEEYILPFNDYRENPTAVNAFLQDTQAELEAIKERGDRLVALASNASTDLQKIYSEQAIQKAKKDLDDKVKGVLNSTNFDIIRENPEFKEDIDKILVSIGMLDFDNASNENINAIYSTITEVKRILNGLYESSKDSKTGVSRFLTAILTSYNAQYTPEHYEKLILYTLSNIDETNDIMKKSLQEFESALGDENAMHKLKLPVVEQIAWIEAMVISAVEKDYLPAIAEIKRKNDGSKIFTSGAFFNGQQGAGKTQVILKFASQIIDQVKKRRTGELNRSSIFAADHESQRNNMLRNKFDEVKIDGDIQNQTDLYNLLVKDGKTTKELVNILSHIDAIFYDEITKIEYYGSEESITLAKTNPEEAPVLEAILAQIEEINKHRKGNPLILIGIGDSSQPGYMKGEPSPRNNIILTEEDMLSGDTTHVLKRGNNYTNADKLSVNFRSIVSGMSKDISDFQSNLDIYKKPTVFKYDTVNGTHVGIKVNKGDFSSIANDAVLYEDLKKKLSEDKDFTVAIVAGTVVPNEDLVNKNVLDKPTLLKQLIDEYSDRVKVYSFDTIQGLEADYVLAYASEDFFHISVDSLKSSTSMDSANKAIFKDRISKFKTMLGRAHSFVNVAYQGDLSGFITSKESNLDVLPPKSNSEFKTNWWNVLQNDILHTDGSVSEVEPEVKTEPEVEVEPEVEPVTEDTPNSALSLNKVTTQGKYISPEITGKTETDTSTVDQVNSKNKIKEYIETIAKDYGIDNLNMSESSILELRSIIEEKSKGLDTERIKQKAIEDLYKLDNAKQIVLGLETGKDIQADLENTLNTIEEEEEVNRYKKKTTDSAFMQTEEVQNRKIVAYQDFTESTKRKDPIKTRNRYNTQVYGSKAMNENDRSGAIRDALTYDDKGIATINTEKYDYYVVSYTGNFEGSSIEDWKNNVLVAKPKGDKGNAFFIAQFPTEGDFAEVKGSMAEFIKDRFARIETDVEGNDSEVQTTIHKDATDNKKYTTKYIESKINGNLVNSIISGRTVGNLVTTDPFVMDVVKRMDLFPSKLPLKEGKAFKTVTRNLTPIINLKNYRGDESVWSDESFKGKEIFTGNTTPFVPTGDSTIINKIEGTDDHYVVIKTTRGNVPFLLQKDERAIPIVGVFDGRLITGDTLIDTESKNYNDELNTVANLLEGLMPSYATQEYTTYKSLINSISKDLITSDINVTLNMDIDSLSLTENEGPAVIENKITTKFLEQSEQFLGNKKLPLNVAKDLWKQTGNPTSSSSPFVIMRGAHAGKAVMFYTFNDKVDLTTYSTAQMVELYKKMAVQKSNLESNFSDNRLGIGMLLLDVKGNNFSELLTLLPEATLDTVTAADVNKAIMNDSVESKIIELFSSLYYASRKGKVRSKSVVEQLKSTILDDISNDWIEKNKGSKHFEILSDLFDNMFDTESIGRVEVTHDTSDEVIDILSQVKLLQSSKYTDAEIDTKINEIFVDAQKSPEISAALSDAKIESPALLKTIALEAGTVTGVGGFLALNSNGKVILQKTDRSILTAVDENWVSKVYGDKDADIAPTPRFNMYKFLEVLNSLAKKDRSEVEGVLQLLDPLLGEIGLTEGMFISPTVASTPDPIAAVSSVITGGTDSIYTTDVKMVKSPQLVFNTDELLQDGALTNTSREIKTKEEVKTNEVQHASDAILSKLSSAKTLPEFNQIISLINDAIKKDTITELDAEKLYEEVHTQFNERIDIPTTGFRILDFSNYILATPATEKVINSFNALRDLTINEDIKKILWEELLKLPNNFLESQRIRLNAILKLSTKETDITNSETIFNITSDIHNNNKLKDLKLETDSEELIDSINSVKEGLEMFNYPAALDLDPMDRVYLLLGLNTNAVGAEGNLITSVKSTINSVDKAFKNNPSSKTNKDKLANWTNAALNTQMRARGVSVEDLALILEADELGVFTVKSDINLLSIKPIIIRRALQILLEANNFEEYSKLLEDFRLDIKGIYYNNENKLLANSMIEENLKKIPSTDETQVLESDIIEDNIEIMNDIEEAKVSKLKDILGNSRETKKMREESLMGSSVLDIVLDKITDEQADTIGQYIDERYTQAELDVGLKSDHAKIIKDIVLDYAGMENYEGMIPVLNLISDLAVDQEFKCFI